MEDIQLSRAVSKPCKHCRKRKVKCDRGRPCRGCVRFNVACIYEDGAYQAPQVSNNDHEELQARLAKVEALLAQQSSNGTKVDEAPDTEKTGISEAVALALKLDMQPEGVLVESEQSSLYVDKGFWANLFQQTDEVQLLVTNTLGPIEDALFGSVNNIQRLSKQFPPTHEQARVLRDLFFERVEPFIAVLHRPDFEKAFQSCWDGTLPTHDPFEPLIYSIFSLTVRILPDEAAVTLFGQSKAETLADVSARARSEFLALKVATSRDLGVLQALLYWITYLYQDANIGGANTLLGATNHLARCIGLHKNPLDLNLDPLKAGTRTRAWNYLCYLNTKPYLFEGAARPYILEGSFFPISINDSRLQPAQSLAIENTCTSFATLRRQYATLTCYMLQQMSGLDEATALNIVKTANDQLQRDFFPFFEQNALPVVRRFEALCVRLWHKRLELSVDAALLKLSRRTGDEYETRLFADALALLSLLERAETAADSLGWSWICRADPEFMAYSILIDNINRRIDRLSQQDLDDAWRQIGRFYQQHDNEEYTLRNTPAWRVVEHWKTTAMNRVASSDFRSAVSFTGNHEI